jgi:hypothetical protein
VQRYTDDAVLGGKAKAMYSRWGLVIMQLLTLWRSRLLIWAAGLMRHGC